MAEIVSIEKAEASGMQTTGLRFLNILEGDRKRITLAVHRLHRKSRDEDF
jgi:c-di-GMP-binding flagellar brake protein YcgR